MLGAGLVLVFDPGVRYEKLLDQSSPILYTCV